MKQKETYSFYWKIYEILLQSLLWLLVANSNIGKNNNKKGNIKNFETLRNSDELAQQHV